MNYKGFIFIILLLYYYYPLSSCLLMVKALSYLPICLTPPSLTRLVQAFILSVYVTPP